MKKCTVRSGVHIYDTLPRDVAFWLIRGAKRVLLRHGVGLKKIERAIEAPDHRLHKLFHGRWWERLTYGALIPWHLPVPDRVIACSPEHAAQAEDYFGVRPDQVRITGFPRHDRLATPPAPDPSALAVVGEPVPPDSRVVLFMPTFREASTPQTFDWSTLQRAASHADVVIATKLHLVDASRGVSGIDELARHPSLRLIEPTVDPIDCYPHAVALITDFSSVAYDFVLLARPVIHYVPDLEEFVEKRPLAIPLDEAAAGPICRTPEELADAVRTVVDSADAAAAEGARMRDRFYTHPPGGASARVVDVVAELVGLPVGSAS